MQQQGVWPIQTFSKQCVPSLMGPRKNTITSSSWPLLFVLCIIYNHLNIEAKCIFTNNKLETCIISKQKRKFSFHNCNYLGQRLFFDRQIKFFRRRKLKYFRLFFLEYVIWILFLLPFKTASFFHGNKYSMKSYLLVWWSLVTA